MKKKQPATQQNMAFHNEYSYVEDDDDDDQFRLQILTTFFKMFFVHYNQLINAPVVLHYRLRTLPVWTLRI
jgi:hypothetical protein